MAKLRLAITTLILLSLPGLVFSAGPAVAAADAVSWSGVNIPTEGKAGGYGLASGSDVGCAYHGR